MKDQVHIAVQQVVFRQVMPAVGNDAELLKRPAGLLAYTNPAP
jgi:hypothetical protein